MICLVYFMLKAGFCKGCLSGKGVLSRKARSSSLSYSQLLFEETAQAYIGDVRCDAEKVRLYILLCNRWFIQYGATAVVGKLFRDVGTLGVSFVLPSSALLFCSSLLFFAFSMQ